MLMGGIETHAALVGTQWLGGSSSAEQKKVQCLYRSTLVTAISRGRV